MLWLPFLLSILVSWLGIRSGVLLCHIAPEERKPLEPYLITFRSVMLVGFISALLFSISWEMAMGFAAPLLLGEFVIKRHKRLLQYGLFGAASAFISTNPEGFTYLMIIIFLYGLPDGTLLVDRKDADMLEPLGFKGRAKNFFRYCPRVFFETFTYPLIAVIAQLLL